MSEFEVIYLFVDGIAERLHLWQPREAVLAPWGILADGKKALLHLAPGTKKDTASCKEFPQDMRRRGLLDPLLVASDGAPGMIRAIEECLPRSFRQRCLAHKIRNLQSKVPEDLWPEFKARAVASYQAASPALARLLRDDVAANLTRDLPSAGTVLMTISRCPSRISGFRWATAGRSAPRMFERLFGRNRDAPRDPACLRRACRFKLVSRTHACGRSLTRVQGQRVRAPPTASNPRRSTRIAAHNAPATGAMITAVPTLFMTGLDRRQYSPKALFILMRKSFRGKFLVVRRAAPP